MGRPGSDEAPELELLELGSTISGAPVASVDLARSFPESVDPEDDALDEPLPGPASYPMAARDAERLLVRPLTVYLPERAAGPEKEDGHMARYFQQLRIANDGVSVVTLDESFAEQAADFAVRFLRFFVMFHPVLAYALCRTHLEVGGVGLEAKVFRQWYLVYHLEEPMREVSESERLHVRWALNEECHSVIATTRARRPATTSA